jgi:hypothetical protein
MHFLATYKDAFTVIISLIGVPLALIAAFNGARTYVRTEQWKRAEFLAKEMKEFFANARVQTAFTLIDWGARYVKLLDDDAPKNGRVLVTRQMQVRALLPHTLKPLLSDAIVFHADGEHEDDELRRFSPEEAAIRDCYDTFLDGLETFASYVQSDLISLNNLRPYLQYWIDDIHAPTKIADDAAWSAALVTYIAVYRYKGVKWLFEQFNRSIASDSPAFKSFLAGMKDKELAQALDQAAREAEYV